MAKILIVDDESNIRMMLRLALEHVGHTVGVAADGYEGLSAFGDGHGWDLVLLDHRMPDMSGLDVLKALRRRRSDCRVVMVSAFGTVDLAAEATRAGATDFLRKPFTVEVLRETVDAALEATLDDAPAGAPARVNGFRLRALTGPERCGDGSLHQGFQIARTREETRVCRVSLPPALQAQVSDPPSDPAFWQSLCAEALANYLWQHASPPPDDPWVVEELTGGLRRWIAARGARPEGA